MAKYFKFFPTTYYLKDNNSSSLDVLTNITSRFGFEKELKENSATYYTYEIKDGDTPEIIAEQIYGSSERHWIVLLFNDIVDSQNYVYNKLNDSITVQIDIEINKLKSKFFKN